MRRFIALAAFLTILGGCENMTEQQKAAGIGTLGGATLDIEENYLMKKLFNAGLGVVSIENQARI